MAFTRLKINHLSIQKKIEKAMANSPVIKRKAYQKAYGIFRHAKRMMLKEFDRHNITQELLAGPEGVNISGTLDGYGNLFSFIGFEQGDEPTAFLRQLLELETLLQQTVFTKNAWHFRIYTPNKEAIEKTTPMPFERGNSWAFAVETYISGLSHYMYKKNISPTSRSGTGLQVGVSGGQTYYEYLEDVTFTGKSYISEILNNFRDRVNRKEA